MSERANHDEELLAQLLRQAGDPHVAPDPHYAETLRASLLDRLAQAPKSDAATEAALDREVVFHRDRKGGWNMKRLARLAVATITLAASIALVCWLTLGSSTNLAFAAVAEALEHLRSATFDVTIESKQDSGSATATGKGFFLAPSHQRIETTVEMKNLPMKPAPHSDNPVTQAAIEGALKAIQSMPKMTSISIVDGQAGKQLMLMPSSKMAIEMDLKKLQENQQKMAKKELPPDLFEMVRRLVREGSSLPDEKVERLGKQTIDGHEAVGFQSHSRQMGDMLVWADPQTARPIRIELTNAMLTGVHMTMSIFQYDVDLDQALFRLEAPAGYSVQTADLTVPTEEDLLRTLRAIAEHNDGKFPAKLAMSEEVMKALMPAADPKVQAEMDAERNAAMDKIAAKYGGKEQMRAKYGKELPPEILAELAQAMAPMQQKEMKTNLPLLQKRMQGLTFYQMLTSENDPHYAGAGVKLGTPDRPIFWYKPTGADKYHVLYADLSVKELTPEEVQQLPATQTP